MPQVPAPGPTPPYGGTPHVREWGDPSLPTLLLIHGLGERASLDFEPVAAGLAERFHLVAPDLPGFGASPAANHRLSPQGFADVLAAVVRQHGRTPVHVLGHSLGGAVAIAFAGAHPELVDRLVLVDVAGVLHREAFVDSQVVEPLRNAGGLGRLAAGVTSTAMGIVRAVEPEPQTILDSDAGRQAALGGDTQRIAALALIAADLGPAFDGIRAPTLVLWGDHDSVAPLRTSVVLTSRIAGARSQLLPGVGHVPMAEQPDLFVERVSAFLSSATNSARGATAMAPVEQHAAQDLVCAGETGRTITGHYRSITLDRCRSVRIVSAEIEKLVVRSSDVVLDAVTIRATGGAALRATGADIRMTGGLLEGRPALDADGSRFDFAGVVLRSSTAPILVREPSRALFSVSVLDGPAGRLHLHGEVVLAAE